jgi:hypothetical protein
MRNDCLILIKTSDWLESTVQVVVIIVQFICIQKADIEYFRPCFKIQYKGRGNFEYQNSFQCI